MEKTTVTIVAPDGMKMEFTGDTALVFTVSDIEDFLNGEIPQMNAESAYVGSDIPECLFIKVIEELVGSVIQKRWEENLGIAAHETRDVALHLLARSERILKNCSMEQLEAELSRIKESLGNIRKMASQHGGGSDGRE